MKLRDYRLHVGQGLAEAARELGIDGINPGQTLSRIELGSRQPEADMVERIARWSGGKVCAEDMHVTRLAWLKTNRPDKFPQDADRVATAAPEEADLLRTSGAALSSVLTAEGLRTGRAEGRDGPSSNHLAPLRPAADIAEAAE